MEFRNQRFRSRRRLPLQQIYKCPQQPFANPQPCSTKQELVKRTLVIAYWVLQSTRMASNERSAANLFFGQISRNRQLLVLEALEFQKATTFDLLRPWNRSASRRQKKSASPQTIFKRLRQNELIHCQNAHLLTAGLRKP